MKCFHLRICVASMHNSSTVEQFVLNIASLLLNETKTYKYSTKNEVKKYETKYNYIFYKIKSPIYS